MSRKDFLLTRHFRVIPYQTRNPFGSELGMSRRKPKTSCPPTGRSNETRARTTNRTADSFDSFNSSKLARSTNISKTSTETQPYSVALARSTVASRKASMMIPEMAPAIIAAPSFPRVETIGIVVSSHSLTSNAYLVRAEIETEARLGF